ncbi:Major Facilitator Superfamily protein [Bremerella volcania]|uniref:Major Facilitator Superfamily protein n=2 Tax=Bremerella volcania TaxID=2527984 RepID=A0A518C5Z0_9BACT|nr:Major Facilitator Superfamily protein [Bremerella volcania]
MLFPLLPQFLITVLGGNRFYLGIIEGVAESLASLLKLGSGAWSDRAGRRKGFVLFGYGFAAVARPLIALATMPWHLFVARIGDRVGKGIRTSPRDAMIADSTGPDVRGSAFGFQRAMDHFGAAVGPVLAALFLWVWPGNLRLLFALSLLPGLAVVTLLLVGLKEPQQIEKSERVKLSMKPFGRSFRIYLLALVIFTLGNSSDAFLLVRASELGVATVMLPLLWFAFHIVKSVGNLAVGRLVDRIGPRAPMFVGWFLYAVVYLAFALATAAWHAWALFLAYGVFYALTEPAEKTLVTDLVGSAKKGLAFGWYNFAIGISALPSSLVFGYLYETFGPLASFGWGAALALLAALLLTSVKPIRNHPVRGSNE